MIQKIKGILLDRDNTLNHDPGFLRDPEQVYLKEGVLEGLRLLKEFGFTFFILTNQSGISRGIIKEKELQRVNEKLLSLLKKGGVHIEKIYICSHQDKDRCDCRKPLPGLVNQLIKEYDLDLNHTYIVGDRVRDILCAKHLNIPGILIFSEDEDKEKNRSIQKLAFQSLNLKEAANFILENEFQKNWKNKFFSSWQNKNFLDKIESWRDQKLRIVFTNGCFDILHSGHIQYLRQAKKLGDKIVLALNSDSSIKRLKGKNRPVNSLEDRALLLSNFDFIDLVVGFEEDNPIKVLEKVKPNIHVKGADYTAEKILEYHVVIKNGGRIIILPYRKGYSTTNIIKSFSE